MFEPCPHCDDGLIPANDDDYLLTETCPACEGTGAAPFDGGSDGS